MVGRIRIPVIFWTNPRCGLVDLIANDVTSLDARKEFWSTAICRADFASLFTKSREKFVY